MSTDWSDETSLSGDDIEILKALDFETKAFEPHRARQEAAASAPNRADDRTATPRPRVPTRVIVIWTVAALMLLTAGWRSILPALVIVAGVAAVKLVGAATRSSASRRSLDER